MGRTGDRRDLCGAEPKATALRRSSGSGEGLSAAAAAFSVLLGLVSVTCKGGYTSFGGGNWGSGTAAVPAVGLSRRRGDVGRSDGDGGAIIPRGSWSRRGPLRQNKGDTAGGRGQLWSTAPIHCGTRGRMRWVGGQGCLTRLALLSPFRKGGLLQQRSGLGPYLRVCVGMRDCQLERAARDGIPSSARTTCWPCGVACDQERLVQSRQSASGKRDALSDSLGDLVDPALADA